MTFRPVAYFAEAAFRLALEAFHRADYDTAFAELAAADQDAATCALRSNILREVGRVEEALDCAYAALAAIKNEEDRALSLCAIACAQTLLGDVERSESTLNGIIGTGFSDDMRSEIGFQRALIAYVRNDPGQAEIELVEAYRDKDPIARARTLQMHACILGAKEDYRQACSLLLRALEDLGQRPCARLEAMALMNLSFLVCEFPMQVDFSILRLRLRLLRWTKNLCRQRFWAHRNFGIRLVLEGGVRASLGLSLLRTSEECATTDAQRVLATLDAAQAGFLLGEPHNGLSALTRADEMARTVDWNSELGNERFAILIAAELFASQNPDRAAGYLRIYDGLPPMEAKMTFAHDRRLEAMENHARGIVSAAIGDMAQAVESLKAALEVFERIRYCWRASACSLKLHELTHEPIYRAKAARLSRAYPESWLAEMVAKIKSR